MTILILAAGHETQYVDIGEWRPLDVQPAIKEATPVEWQILGWASMFEFAHGQGGRRQRLETFLSVRHVLDREVNMSKVAGTKFAQWLFERWTTMNGPISDATAARIRALWFPQDVWAEQRKLVREAYDLLIDGMDAASGSMNPISLMREARAAADKLALLVNVDVAEAPLRITELQMTELQNVADELSSVTLTLDDNYRIEQHCGKAMRRAQDGIYAVLQQIIEQQS